MILVFRYFKIKEDYHKMIISNNIFKYNMTKSFKTYEFIIPLGRTSKVDAEKYLKEIMKLYKQEIKIP